MSDISLQRLLVRNLINRMQINDELGVKISNDSIVTKFRPILFLQCILLIADLLNFYKIWNLFFKPVVQFKHSSLKLLNGYKTNDVFVLSRVNHDRITDVLNEFKDQSTVNYFVLHAALKFIARLSDIVSNKYIERDLHRENIFDSDVLKKARYALASTYLKYYLFLCIAFIFRKKIMVIREEAHYQHSFLFNAWFKMRDILVCEPQHGLIYKSHDAYNFSAAEFQSGIAKYLPDVLFTFGDYWHDKFNSPAERVVLGKESSYRRARETQSNSLCKRALIISDGLNFEFFLNLALNIRSVVGEEYSVLLRPHPSERQSLLESSILLAERSGIIIDLGDLTDSLSNCDYVVSEMSTVLYESMAFGCTILMVYSQVSRFVFGLTESNILHVVDDVNLVDFKSIVDCDPLEVYSPDFTHSYKNYLKDKLYVWNS